MNTKLKKERSIDEEQYDQIFEAHIVDFSCNNFSHFCICNIGFWCDAT